MTLRCLAFFSLCLAITSAHGESLRCKGDIVEIGDVKATVFSKCGKPEMTDSYCEKTQHRIIKSNGEAIMVDACDNVDVWTYNPGYGQFWTNLYFSEGKLREMKYGDRVQ